MSREALPGPPAHSDFSPECPSTFVNKMRQLTITEYLICATSPFHPHINLMRRHYYFRCSDDEIASARLNNVSRVSAGKSPDGRLIPEPRF